MDEGVVRYCTTTDGVRIGYGIAGDGPAVLITPTAGCESFTLRYSVPPWRTFHERLLDGYRRIDYDVGGSGQSQRDVTGVSLETMTAEITAVVEASGERNVSIWAPGVGVTPALVYASRAPEKVRSLVLWGGFVSAAGAIRRPETIRSLAAYCRADWRLAARTFAGAADAFDTQTAVYTDMWARYMVESTSGDVLASYIESRLSWDVSDLLDRVTTPALVLHRRHDGLVRYAAGQDLASRLPDARFVALDGDQHDPSYGDSDAVIAAVRPFLAETSGKPTKTVRNRRSPPATSSSVRTILFTDVVSHTALMERLGDDAGRAVLRQVERLTREAVRANDGAEIKMMGDGFMAAFDSPTQATQAAMALQRAVGDDVDLRRNDVEVRAGLNAGEPMSEDGDLFGASVIVAARLASLARGGQILVPEPVRHLLAGKNFQYTDRGEVTLKGFSEPVRISEVVW